MTTCHAAYLGVSLLLASSLAGQTVAADLASLERRANTEFLARDCAAAEKTYGEALRMAQAAEDIHRTGLYHIRIGNCRTRIGDFSTSLESYRKVIAVGEAASDDELLAVGIHGAALQLNKLGRLEEALPLGQREYELAQKCGHPTHMARAMWVVGILYEGTGRVRDGVAMMNRALTISRTTTDVAMTGVLLDNLAITYLALGDPETAAHLEKEILAIPRTGLDTMATTSSPAITYNNLGEILLKAGNQAEARKSFEKSVETSTAPENWRVRMDALLNLAELQNKAGQIAESDAGFEEALRIAESVKFPEVQSNAWKVRSDMLLVRGDFKGASDAGVESLRIARQLASSARTYKALAAIGAARAAGGDQTSARESFDEALRIGETLRAQSPSEVSDLSRSFQNLLPLYQASVRNLMDLHLPADALQRAEQAKARVLMDILLRGGVDEGIAMTPAEAAEQIGLRKRLATASAAAAHASTPASTQAVEDAMVEFRQFRRAFYENHPELTLQSADFEAADPGKLAALLSGPKTALLDYFFVPSGVALFVVRQTSPIGTQPKVSTYFLPDPKHTLSAEARAFRECLARRDLDYKTAAQHLFNRLLSPALADLSGATDWIVSPDGALWDIPFEALVDPAGRHVIETHSVALAPSLSAALEIHQRNRPEATEGIRLLAFGNPLPSSAPLPDAAREVEEIGTHYPRGSALVLTGASATAAEFRDKAPSASIIHLAAHAGLNDSDPLSSFVSLGTGRKGSGDDGTLTALAIMSLHLHANMVVLSACETALGSTGTGEGMIGMGWALSAAGASSSVLSLWKVDSAASKDFMTSFYRNLAARGSSVSRSEALRQAGLGMLRSEGYRHPFYWAAFTLQGDGSPSSVQSAAR
jgi:CHAT domain-containing protein/tetratricopeptide (TPR) repeat protein